MTRRAAEHLRPPTHAETSGCASTHQRDGDRETVASRQPRAFEQQPLQPVVLLRRVRVDDDGEEHGVDLVGQPLRARDDPIGDRPDRDRCAAQEDADDDFVELVIELVGPVDDRRVDAEPGDFAQPAAAEERRTDAQGRIDAVGVPAVDEVGDDPHGGRRRDERDQRRSRRAATATLTSATVRLLTIATMLLMS